MKTKVTNNQINNSNAVAFYRVSTTKQDNERQYADVKQHCNAYGIKIIKEFEETISGAAKLEDRKELQNLLKYVEDNKPQYVVVSELSRLARSQDAVNIIKNWTAQGVCFISHKEGIRTLDDQGNTTAVTTLLLQILSALNEFELTTITYRVKSGLHKTIKNGIWSGGNAPYGYNIQNKQLVINPIESKTVKFMFEKYSIGWGTHKIASYLNLNNIYTKNGVSWVDSKVYKILNNSISIGKRVWLKETFEIPHLKIIDEGLFYTVQERLQNNANTSDINKHNKYEYLLTGKIICACGKSFVGQHRHNNYMCRSQKFAGGCKTKPIKLTWLEDQIKGKLIENESELLYDNTKLLSKVGEMEIELSVLEADLKAEKRTQNNLLNQIGTIGESIFQSKYTKSIDYGHQIESKIESIQKKLEASKSAEMMLMSAKFKLGTNGNYHRTGIEISKEVLQKVIDVININNENVNVILTNGNTFSIVRQ